MFGKNTKSRALLVMGWALCMIVPTTALPSVHGSQALPTSGDLAGNGYAAVKLDWRGTEPVTLRLMLGAAVGAEADGAAVIKPDGTIWGVIGEGDGIAGNNDCLIVASDQTGPVHESCQVSTAQGLLMSLSPTGNPYIGMTLSAATGDVPGVYTLLVWQAFRASEQMPGSWRLESPPGEATVLGVTTGSSTYFATPPDFQHGLRAGASIAGVFADANVGSHYRMQVHHAPMAWITPDKKTGKTPGMQLLTPAGSATCECFMFNLGGPGVAPPSAYDVQLTRAAGGVQQVNEGFVILVDPELPS